MKKRILNLLIAFITLFSFTFKVEAASLTISASTKSVTNGGSVSITVKADGLAGKFSITSSNGNVLSGGTSSVWIENESKTYKFSAKSIGSATIKVTPIDVADSNGNVYSSSKSVTINVVKPREKSTNNNLKSLNVEGYSLSPDFNKDTLEYSVELPADQTKIKINASKEDGYASLNGAGEKDVVEGENRFEIVVTSETGKSKTYVLLANVKDNNPIIVEVDDKELTVVKRNTSLTKPSEDFTDTKVTINETEIPAFYNEKTNITLVGLKDSEGITNLYIYDEEEQTYTKYQSLKSNSIQVIFTEAKTIPEDYKETTIKIDEQEYVVYQNPKIKGYYLVYGMNLETGKSDWYKYNEEEKTLQLYDNQDVTKITKEYEKDIENYKMVIIGLGAFSIILLVTILILVFTRKK